MSRFAASAKTNIQKLLQEAQSLTGLTQPALARKLGVSLELLERVSEGSFALLPEPQERLRQFLAQIGNQQNKPVSLSPEAAEGVWQGDSIQLLASLPENSVDMILSDIPYGISLEEWDVLHENRNRALLGQSKAQQQAGKVFAKRRKPINGWSLKDKEIPKQYYQWCLSWASQWLRVLKPGASAMIFAGRRYAPRCIVALEDAGFNLRDQLAWVKPKAPFLAQRLAQVFKKRGDFASATQWEGWRVGNLAPLFEPVIWCFKPYPTTLADNMRQYGVGAMNSAGFKEGTGGYDNVIYAGLAKGEGGLHAAQKPVKLLQTLIQLTCPEGGLVLDPFAGSGSTGVAALACKRRYLLMEQDKTTYRQALARLAALL